MNKLKEARDEIERIDKEISSLFCERMAAVKNVALYKKEHGLPIFDAQREADLIEKNASYVNDPELRSFYINFLKAQIEISKNYQHKLLDGIRVAYSGVEGAFAHIASKRIFPDGNMLSHNDFLNAYKAVENGDCDCCVLPVENSYAGEVGQVTDLMFEGSLHLNGFYDLKIVHNLLALPGAKKDDIKTVISHPQALSQCDSYIRKMGFEQNKAKNTAVAAQLVSEGNDKSIAAIASVETASLYGLSVLDHDINESGDNTTRFAVFSRVENRIENPEQAKFVLIFTVRNIAGALAKTVNVIAKYGFNMRVLRSRPVKNQSWHYYFYVEAEGDPYSEKGKQMMQELNDHCHTVKIVGCYDRQISLDSKEIL